MYYGEPYTISRPSIRQLNALRNVTTRYVLFCGLGLCCLLSIATGITLLIVYFVRYRNVVTSMLSYPDFVCSGRPCGCPNYNYGQLSMLKVVGGNEPLPYTYPWLVTLTQRYATNSFCAGFIISSNAILTAAHCVYGRNPFDIQILAKVHDLQLFSGERYNIDRVYVHPEYRYNDTMRLNDIAIIKITQTFPSELRSCCLPRSPSSIYPRAQTKAVVSGWRRSQSTFSVLQHAVVPIVDEQNIKCRSTIIDSTRQLCAGYTTLSIGTCSGDSGSPLLIVEYDDQNQGHFVAAGIVSYGNRQCDRTVSSGIYTRVGFYIPWIQSIL